MTTRIGLMGFGRIGRSIYHLAQGRTDIEIVQISDIAEPETLLHLLKYSSWLGRFPAPVKLEGNQLHVGKHRTHLVAGRNPGDVNWQEHGVDVVIEATGKPRSRQEMQKHLEQGAKKVVMCVRNTDAVDATVLMGFNSSNLQAKHQIISNGSMAAHCVVPLARVVEETFGIEQLFYSTLHAYTAEQGLADVPAAQMRLSRAGAANVVPIEEQAIAQVLELVPSLRNKVTSAELRVPVSDGSMADLVCFTQKPLSVDAVNQAVAKAAEHQYAGLVEYVADPIVSSDVKHSSYSCAFDAGATMALGSHAVKLIAWFDNGWAYANRALELAVQAGKLAGGLS